MAEFIVEIKGSGFTLDDIQLMIAEQEAAAAEFDRSNMSYHEHAITNLLTFKELPRGTTPGKPLLLSRTGTPPVSDGMQLAWAGVMLIGGVNVAVTASR